MIESHSRRKEALFLPLDGGEIGGVARVVSALAREMQGRGWNTRVALPQAFSEQAAWYGTQGVAAETHPAVPGIYSPRGYPELRALTRFIHDCKPDVVNLHCGGSYISIKEVLAARLAGPHRLVATIHLADRASLRWKERTTTRLSASLVHRIVCVSNGVREVVLESGVPPQKTLVIPNGV